MEAIETIMLLMPRVVESHAVASRPCRLLVSGGHIRNISSSRPAAVTAVKVINMDADLQRGQTMATAIKTLMEDTQVVASRTRHNQ